SGRVVLGYWSVVVDIDAQGTVLEVAILVGDTIGQGEVLVVLLVARGMLDRIVLGDGIGTGGAVERQGQHGNAALLDQQRASGPCFVGEARGAARGQPLHAAAAVGAEAEVQ